MRSRIEPLGTAWIGDASSRTRSCGTLRAALWVLVATDIATVAVEKDVVHYWSTPCELLQEYNWCSVVGPVTYQGRLQCLIKVAATWPIYGQASCHTIGVL